MVAKGEVELALFNQVELPAGVRLAGSVPVPLQDYTFYEVAVLANGAAPEAAQSFIQRMTDAGRAQDLGSGAARRLSLPVSRRVRNRAIALSVHRLPVTPNGVAVAMR